ERAGHRARLVGAARHGEQRLAEAEHGEQQGADHHDAHWLRSSRILRYRATPASDISTTWTATTATRPPARREASITPSTAPMGVITISMRVENFICLRSFMAAMIPRSAMVKMCS